MKKIVSLLIAALMLMSCAAMAEIEVVRTTYIPAEVYTDSYYGYFFAEVVNNGEEPVYIGDSYFNVLDPDGNIVATCDLYSINPSVLAPGATGYVYNWQSLDGISSVDEVPGYEYCITSEDAYYDAPQSVTVSDATFEYGEDTFGDMACTVHITVQNDTDETLYEPNVIYALYDQNGDLLDASDVTLYYAGVPAGQSTEAFFEISDGLVKAWVDAGKEPATVVGMAFLD